MKQLDSLSLGMCLKENAMYHKSDGTLQIPVFCRMKIRVDLQDHERDSGMISWIESSGGATRKN